jgi:hypothetical protein
MKYIITEKQLRILRKYMKSFVNEDVVRGTDALKTFPFSELPETYEEYKNNRFKLNIQNWGDRVDVPSGGDSLRSIKTKRDLIEFINSFEEEYGEDPMFEINPNADWHSKIQIVNDRFKGDSESYTQQKSRELDKYREKGWSID